MKRRKYKNEYHIENKKWKMKKEKENKKWRKRRLLKKNLQLFFVILIINVYIIVKYLWWLYIVIIACYLLMTTPGLWNHPYKHPKCFKMYKFYQLTLCRITFYADIFGLLISLIVISCNILVMENCLEADNTAVARWTLQSYICIFSCMEKQRKYWIDNHNIFRLTLYLVQLDETIMYGCTMSKDSNKPVNYWRTTKGGESLILLKNLDIY